MFIPPDYQTLKLEQKERIELAEQHRQATVVRRSRRSVKSWFLPLWRKPAQVRPARPVRLAPDARF